MQQRMITKGVEEKGGEIPHCPDFLPWRIITTAFEGMCIHGAHFTMAELARKLGVSKTTIYQHFESKEQLVAAIMDLQLADISQQSDAIFSDPELNAMEKVSGMFAVWPTVLGHVTDCFLLDTQRYYPGEWEKVEGFKEKSWQKIESLVCREIEAGAIRPMNLAVVRKVYFMAESMLDYQFLTQNNLTMHDALAAFGELLAFGLKGREGNRQRG